MENSGLRTPLGDNTNTTNGGRSRVRKRETDSARWQAMSQEKRDETNRKRQEAYLCYNENLLGGFIASYVMAPWEALTLRIPRIRTTRRSGGQGSIPVIASHVSYFLLFRKKRNVGLPPATPCAWAPSTTQADASARRSGPRRVPPAPALTASPSVAVGAHGLPRPPAAAALAASRRRRSPRPRSFSSCTSISPPPPPRRASPPRRPASPRVCGPPSIAAATLLAPDAFASAAASGGPGDAQGRARRRPLRRRIHLRLRRRRHRESITTKQRFSICEHFVFTSSMMAHPQNSIEAPNKVLPNTSEPKFKGGEREKKKGGEII